MLTMFTIFVFFLLNLIAEEQMSRIGVSLIKFGNRIFKPVRHPFNLADSGEMSYAEWQYEKGMDTVACYAPHPMSSTVLSSNMS